jgi:hypothetical protein
MIARAPGPHIALLITLAACGAPAEPPLRVGAVAFTAEQLGGAGSAALPLLADLAALGQAAAEGGLESLVAPAAAQRAEATRLESLPLFLGARRAGIGEERLREVYAGDPEPELTVRHLVRLVPVGASQAQRAAARAVAVEAERRARAGEDFGQLAGELSEEPGAAERGGLLRPGREGSWVEPFWRAARELSPGEVSPVVETEYGYHVLRLESASPVPFQEASRARLLRRLVPPEVARWAMEEWAATRPPVELEPEATAAWLRFVDSGAHLPALPLARSLDGDAVAADEIVGAWVMLESSEQQRLRRDAGALAGWLRGMCRERLWSRAAGEMGVPAAEGAEPRIRAELTARAARAAAALGFRPGMEPRRIAAASAAAFGARGQEASIAREEAAALRPLLRAAYPPSGSAWPALDASSSSSEMRNSENTR